MNSVIQALLIDLSLRTDNKTTGSGLGGSVEGLAKLLSFPIVMDPSVSTITHRNRAWYFNQDWLTQATSLKSVREAFDTAAQDVVASEDVLKAISDPAHALEVSSDHVAVQDFQSSVKAVLALKEMIEMHRNAQKTMTPEDKKADTQKFQQHLRTQTELLKAIDQMPFHFCIYTCRNLLGLSAMIDFQLDELINIQLPETFETLSAGSK